MHRLHGLLSAALTFAAVAVGQAVLAGEISPADVTFARGYEASFKRAYGAREVEVLRSQIVDALSQARRSAGSSCTLALKVTLERAAPTHPTMQQQMDNPSLDPIRTVFRDGGASLSGQVLDSSGHVLSVVRYKYFTGGLPPLTPAKDPWGDARIAIDRFSRRLVDACSKQSSSTRN